MLIADKILFMPN